MNPKVCDIRKERDRKTKSLMYEVNPGCDERERIGRKAVDRYRITKTGKWKKSAKLRNSYRPN